MISFNIPEEKKIRVIINTDAKNEVDDQYAIVQAALTESFDLKAFIAAHFGEMKSLNSEQESYDEIMLVLDKMGMKDKFTVLHGAKHAFRNENEPVMSEGAQFIIEEAMKDDDRPLYIAFLGPLTDMAAAIMACPEIVHKNITVIWIGGGNWPEGGSEYNQNNDIISANIVFKSEVPVWQIPRNVYRMMPVTFAELYARVYNKGEIGKYLAENVVLFNNEGVKRPTEYRVLGDSPAIGVMLYDDCGEWEMKPAPEITEDRYYKHTGKYRPIRVYKNMNSRFIFEDLYAKLELFVSEK